MSSAFHFTAETPSDALFSDIQTLNKFSDEPFCELVSIVFAFLLEPSKRYKGVSKRFKDHEEEIQPGT